MESVSLRSADTGKSDLGLADVLLRQMKCAPDSVPAALTVGITTAWAQVVLDEWAVGVEETGPLCALFSGTEFSS